MEIIAADCASRLRKAIHFGNHVNRRSRRDTTAGSNDSLVSPASDVSGDVHYVMRIGRYASRRDTRDARAIVDYFDNNNNNGVAGKRDVSATSASLDDLSPPRNPHLVAEESNL